MRIKLMTRTAIAALVLTAAGAAQAAEGSFVCKDGFGTVKEVKAQVGGSAGFTNIVSLYVARWDAQEARRLCSAHAAGKPVAITCLDGRRDWSAIKASIPSEYFGGSNQRLASSYTAELQKGTGHLEALQYCRSVGAIK